MKLFNHLYIQVLTAIVLGVLVGHFFPEFGAMLKPLGDGFVKLIKMIIAPIIFCTVVSGIAHMSDTRKIGRVGGKAILYFEVVSTIALLIGMAVINLVGPGNGMNIDPTTLDTKGISKYTEVTDHLNATDFILHIIPDTFVSAFSEGEMLQVLFLAVLSGFALLKMGQAGQKILHGTEMISQMVFNILGIVMRVAPIGAFGAMAFTIGKYGVGSLQQLGALMICFYLTCLLFIVVVLGLICRLCGFSLFKFLGYIKEELLLVLGTSSSESALPRLITKLEQAGAEKSVVGLVVPTGYSFNLDGTSIYLTMAAIFIAQATNSHLNFGQQLALLGILLLTSKGAAGVTGSGFVVLAGTLSALGTVPVAGLAIILGIDRFMSEGRAITNIIGNGVATLAIARSEGALDMDRLHRILNGEKLPPVNSDVANELRGEGHSIRYDA